MNIRLLIAILFYCALNANSQELYGKYLGIERGLLSKECYDINFSKEGYLLVGTQYGPMKYDGERFIPICLNLPVERRIIYDFEQNNRGEIYLLNSRNEVFVLKKDKAVKLSVRKTESIGANIHFKKLHWYSKGLMIISNEAFYNYLFKSKTLTACSKLNQLDKNVKIYNFSSEFPFERKMSMKTNIPVHEVVFRLPKKTIITTVNRNNAESREDYVRVGKTVFTVINAQLYRISNNKTVVFPYEHILFIEYFHNRIWLATVNGLLELDRSGKLVQAHFRGQIIGGVAPLPDKGIAVSLNQKGVFICTDINERRYPEVKPTQVACNKKHIIVGSQTGELYCFRNNKLIKIHDRPALGPGIMTGINTYQIKQIEFIKNRWHICNMNGIYSLSDDLKTIETKMFERYYSFSDFFFSNGRLYAISWSGIRGINPIGKQYNLPLIRCKYQLNDSVILLGSEVGLFEFHMNSMKLVRSPLLKNPIYISSIQALLPNEFLVSSRYKGIFLFRNGRMVKKYQAPCFSLKKAIIYRKKLIAAGNQGVYVQSLKRSGENSWTKIFTSEIQNIFVIRGKLFIFADDAIITKELKTKYETRKPSVVLAKVMLGNEQTKSIPKEIDYNVPISMDFDILSFDASPHKFYYRLSGNTCNASYSQGTELHFEALSSGNYHLEIFPVISGRIQFSNVKHFVFTIKKPFWETTLFYLLILIVVLLLLLSIRLIRNLQRRKRITERAELESKISEYKLLAVKAQVNPHFLSNGLAAIQALILKGDNDYAAHYLAKFSFLMRKILYYSDTQFISVNHELQLVDAYLELELLRTRNHFTINKHILLTENELNTFKIPSLLLQPILENAIWHGLKARETDPQLLISLKIDAGGLLVIEVGDNGPGFDNKPKKDGHVSKGNQLIHERIETLNQQFQKTVAQMEISTSTAGTTVLFRFHPDLYKSE